MKKNLFSITITVVLFFVFLGVQMASAYVSVKGYYRSNGTYVQPYVRSNPNGLKYDNYGYQPSQGLYNESYGTRGNSWDTPTYITDPDYYIGKDIYDSGNYAAPTVPTCPINSYYDGVSSCKCNYGYLVSGGSCVSADSLCSDQVGFNSSYDSVNNTCKCNSGYVIGSSGKCTNANFFCSDKLGYNSSYNSLSKTCECDAGYLLDYSGQCASVSTICQNKYGLNAYGVGNSCYCSSGYQFDSTNTACIPIPTISCPTNSILVGQNCICNFGTVFKNGQCISYAEDCRLTFGDNVIGVKGNDMNSSCDCASGYTWNASQTACIKIEIQSPPAPMAKPLVEKINPPKEKQKTQIAPTVKKPKTAKIVNKTIIVPSDKDIKGINDVQQKHNFFTKVFSPVRGFFANF